MGITIDIEYSNGIYSITCQNDYGLLRNMFTAETVSAVGLECITSEVEDMFFRELLKTDISE